MVLRNRSVTRFRVRIRRTFRNRSINFNTGLLTFAWLLSLVVLTTPQTHLVIGEESYETATATATLEATSAATPTRPATARQEVEATATHLPTSTPPPTPTLWPTLEPLTGGRVWIRLSYYWPPLGGPNCANFDRVNKVCLSATASGEAWELWVDRGLACPTEFWLYTIFTIDGKDYSCIDRGELVVKHPDGSYWVDILTSTPWFHYGELRKAYVR